MTEPILLREDTGAVRRLTLNRPATLNALSEEMLDALQAELDALLDARGIRAVIIAGAGTAFCAGHDLKEMTAARQSPDGGRRAYSALFTSCARVMQTIPRLPQPVIAEVHGIATAAGCQLVASCDMAVAAEDARFGVNGINIGLFCSTPMVALTRAVPRKAAFEMLTTGRFVSAEEAQRLGLVNRVVPANRLRTEADGLAETLAGKLASAVKIGKRAFYEQIEMPLAQAYVHTGEVMVENMLRQDTAEGVRGFIEKRPPDWRQDG